MKELWRLIKEFFRYIWEQLTAKPVKDHSKREPLLTREAEALREELSKFRLEALTPERILKTAALAFPDRLGSAIWVDVRGGDAGLTVTVVRHKKIDLSVLLGQRTFGGAITYEIAHHGNVTVSMGAGIVTPWVDFMEGGDWAPAAVFRLKF